MLMSGGRDKQIAGIEINIYLALIDFFLFWDFILLRITTTLGQIFSQVVEI